MNVPVEVVSEVCAHQHDLFLPTKELSKGFSQESPCSAPNQIWLSLNSIILWYLVVDSNTMFLQRRQALNGGVSVLPVVVHGFAVCAR